MSSRPNGSERNRPSLTARISAPALSSRLGVVNGVAASAGALPFGSGVPSFTDRAETLDTASRNASSLPPPSYRKNLCLCVGPTAAHPPPTPAARLGTRPPPSFSASSSRRVAALSAAAISGSRNSRICTLLSSSIFSRIFSTFSGSRYSGLTHRAKYFKSSASGPSASSSSASSLAAASPLASADACAAAAMTAWIADGNGTNSAISSSSPAPSAPRVLSCVSVARSLPSGGAAAWYQPEMERRGLPSANTSCTAWKLRPGCTVKNAMEFHFGSKLTEGSTAGVPGDSTGYSSSAPPSSSSHPSSGSVR